MKAWNNGFLHLCINIALLAATILFTILLVREGYDGPGAAKYRGTVTDNGFFWVNPFYSTRKLSLRARNMDVAPIKVNDKNGNPIMIGLVLVWKIKNTYKACFDIEVGNTTRGD